MDAWQSQTVRNCAAVTCCCSARCDNDLMHVLLLLLPLGFWLSWDDGALMMIG